MSVESITRPALRRRIATALQDDLVHGTATAGTSTTLVDTNLLGNYSDDSFNGAWIRINAGTGVGQERAITDFVGSTSTITVGYAWGTTPDATSVYEIHRRFSAAQYDAAIDQAIRRSRWSMLHDIQLKRDLTNCAIGNPLFTEWNSAATLPDGWVNDTTHIDHTIVNSEHFIGNDVKVSAMVWSDNANFQMVVADGSGSTAVNHSGNSQWELLEVTHSCTDLSLEVRFKHNNNLNTVSRVASKGRGPYDLRLIDTSSNIAIVDWAYMKSDRVKYMYEIDDDDADGTEHRGFMHYLYEVRYETGIPTADHPSVLPTIALNHHYWTVSSGTMEDNDHLLLEKGLPDNRLLELRGLGAELTGGDDDDVLRVNSEVIELYALYRLKMTTEPQEARLYLDDWNRIKSETRTIYPAFGEFVTDV